MSVTTGSPKARSDGTCIAESSSPPGGWSNFFCFFFFRIQNLLRFAGLLFILSLFYAEKSTKIPRSHWGFLPDQAAGFHFPFKNIFCRVHTPGLLHFLSSSDMPDPDSFCRSYFCYGTSIQSLKSTRAVLHTDPIPAELPLPAVLRQSLPAVILPLPAFQRFLPP